MEMDPQWHDTDEKVLHNGTVLAALPAEPSAAEADQDIAAGLDNLFNHPNTGPFIARLLIQRFVKSNPTSRYIDAVAAAFNDNGAGVRGDFGAVVKEILLNDEALNSYSYTTLRRPWALQVEGGGTEHARLQEPVIRYTSFLRAFSTGSTHPDGYYAIPDRSYWLNQEAYKAPHVFNYYLPNHVPGGDLQDYRPKGRIPNRTVYAPEFEIMTAVATNRIANRIRADVRSVYEGQDALRFFVRRYNGGGYSNVPFYVLFDFSEEIAAAADPAALVQDLDLLLCHGSLSDTAKTDLATIVTTHSGTGTNRDLYRAKGAIMSLLTAPDCAVHE
jgi:uncharacterized protein (DUF1800 family)